MNKYENLILSSNAYKSLERDIKNKTVSQSYIFSSPDELGLKILSKLFLSRLLCDKLCGECNTCKRIENGTYPDIINLPFKEKVLSEDIDYLTSTAAITPTEGDYKYYCIANAESMNESAQNKLLKTLEEPPASCHIILLCTNLSNFLPTIISRCRKVELEPFSQADIEMELAEFYPQDFKFNLALLSSRGMIGYADKIINSEKYIKLFQLSLDTLLFMKTSGNISKFAFEYMMQKDNLEVIIEYLEIIFRDILMYHNKRPQYILSQTILKDIVELNKLFSQEVILKEFEVLTRAKKRIISNGNVSSIIDELLFSILEVKAKCR